MTGRGPRPCPISRRHWRPPRWTTGAIRRPSSTPPTSTPPPNGSGRASPTPAFTERYWRHPLSGGVSYRSDWEKGSTYEVAYEEVGLVVSDPEQVILESDPYRRLAYTWHTFTPDWAARHGFDEAIAAVWRAEPRSKVAFDIEETTEGVVKLTVVHDGFEPGSEVLDGRHERVAGRHRQPEDASGDRVGPAGRLSGGLPPAVPGRHAPGRPRGVRWAAPLASGRFGVGYSSILLRSEAIMSIRHALLALLSEGPKYGLQLRQEFEARTGDVWPLNVGQVYTTLQRLERDGLVESDDSAEEGPQKGFHITAEGAAELDSWLRTPPDFSSPPRDELVIKVLVALGLPGVDVHEVVQVHRRYLVELMQQWTRLKEDESRFDLNFALVVDAELFRLDSLIRWLDTADGRLKRAAVEGDAPAPQPFPLPKARRKVGVPQ